MPITQAMLENLFRYHRPHGNQAERYESIRANAKLFAEIVVMLTPAGPDQEAAILKLRECVFLANAAIACGEKEPATEPADEDTRKVIRVEKV